MKSRAAAESGAKRKDPKQRKMQCRRKEVSFHRGETITGHDLEQRAIERYVPDPEIVTWLKHRLKHSNDAYVLHSGKTGSSKHKVRYLQTMQKSWHHTLTPIRSGLASLVNSVSLTVLSSSRLLQRIGSRCLRNINQYSWIGLALENELGFLLQEHSAPNPTRLA